MHKLLATVAITALLVPAQVYGQEGMDLPDTEQPMTEAPDSGAGTEEEAAPPPDSVLPEQESQELLSSWVTGTQVMSTDMEAIGNIRDLLLDEESGEVTGAVLSVGGFLGIGSKAIAVDWSELNFDYDANEITIELTREEAENAPAYQFRDRENPPAPEPATETGTGTGTGTGTTTGM